MFRFMRAQGCDDYAALHRWSVEHPAAFWEALCEFCDVQFAEPAKTTLAHPDDIMHAGWFTGATLNYAEHLLRYYGERAAVIFSGEDGTRREISFDALRQAVADIAAGLRQAGIGKGDRVAGFVPNCPEAIIAMLAATSLGAIWSSCSPDFGVNGVVDRFGQIEPKILFASNGYYYNGKRIDSLPVVAAITEAIPSIERTVIVPFLAEAGPAEGMQSAIDWHDFAITDSILEFLPVEFDHPLFIMYSSGTTGAPKCIVHGHGGSLLQHLKEHRRHTDVGPDDGLFDFTTVGWVMCDCIGSYADPF